MHKLSFVVFAVILVAAAVGCESELQRQERMAWEEAERIDKEFAEKLNEILTDGQKVDENDPEATLSIIGKLEELQREMTGVDPRLQDEFKKAKYGWYNNYIRLADAKYREVVAAANKQVGMDEYEAAIAEMSKFPEVLTRRHTYGDKVENYKGAIKAWASAPGKAHAIIDEAKQLAEDKQYEEAMAKCDEYYTSMAGKAGNPAIRFVIGIHISILEEMLDEMARKGQHDEALKKINTLAGSYKGKIFNDLMLFLGNKAKEIGEKAAQEK